MFAFDHHLSWTGKTSYATCMQAVKKKQETYRVALNEENHAASWKCHRVHPGTQQQV